MLNPNFLNTGWQDRLMSENMQRDVFFIYGMAGSADEREHEPAPAARLPRNGRAADFRPLQGPHLSFFSPYTSILESSFFLRILVSLSRPFFLCILVCLVMYDSGKVSLEHPLLPRHPSQRLCLVTTLKVAVQDMYCMVYMRI